MKEYIQTNAGLKMNTLQKDRRHKVFRNETQLVEQIIKECHHHIQNC